jgi:hypothetical protein
VAEGGAAAAVTVGSKMAVAKRRRSDRATDGRVPCGFFLFQLIKNWLKIVKLKWMPYLLQKFPICA